MNGYVARERGKRWWISYGLWGIMVEISVGSEYNREIKNKAKTVVMI